MYSRAQSPWLPYDARIYTASVLENLQPFTSRGTNIYTVPRRLEILEMAELKQEVSVSRVTFSRPTHHDGLLLFPPLVSLPLLPTAFLRYSLFVSGRVRGELTLLTLRLVLD